jgi:hypothetical protein
MQQLASLKNALQTLEAVVAVEDNSMFLILFSPFHSLPLLLVF